jgi:DNA invertase Pin-like site-specific DNA recombinase
MAIYGYVRVSSEDQNEARQIEALNKYNIDKWFIEKVSGKDMNRPKLQELLECAQAGDIIVVESISRLTRRLMDFLELMESFSKRGIVFESLKEGVNTNSSFGNFSMTIFAAVSQLERDTIKQRQAEGIELARREGKYKGRRATPRPARWAEYLEFLRERKLTKRELARMLKISRPTLDRLLGAEGLAAADAAFPVPAGTYDQTSGAEGDGA